jgi:hypothetical protein
MIALGTKVKDDITGFVGITTGYVKYISGCNQYLVTPGVDEKGALVESHWFDEQRVKVMESAPSVRLDNSKTSGFDKPAPKR